MSIAYHLARRLVVAASLVCWLMPLAAYAGGFGIKMPSAAANKAPQPLVIRDKWAVLIGLTKYQDESIPALKQTPANLALLTKVMKNPNAGRFADDHITTLFDVQASKKYAQYVTTEDWLIKKALPSDLILIYMCGRALFKDDDAVLCTYDTAANSPASGVSIKDLLAEVYRRTQCKNIVCLLDLSPVSEDAPTPPRQLWQNIANADKVTILAASPPGYPSYRSSVMGSSLFTNYVAEGLQTGGGGMTLEAIAQYVCQSTETDARLQSHKVQQPQFVLSPENREIGKIVPGIASKNASLRQSQVSFGHPVDQLAYSRPDLMPGAKAVQKHEEPADDDDSDSQSSDNVDFSPYMVKMKKDIQAKWKTPKGIDQRKVVTVFRINRDGSITDPTIVDGSGVETIDKSALDALHDASPLDPLPKGAPKSVQIRYVFDWRVSHQ